MRRFHTVTVDVDVYIGEFDDAALVHEIRKRGFSVSAPPAKWEKMRGCGVERDDNNSMEDELALLASAIRDHRLGDALAQIDRLLQPKYRDIGACRAAYDQLRKAVA